MKHILLLAFFLFFSLSTLSGQDLNLKKLETEWYGQLQDNGSNNVFLCHILLLEENKNHYIEFSIPELFNNKFKAKVDTDRNKILLSEHEQLTGYANDFDGITEIELTDGKLIGTWFDGQEIFADFTFSSFTKELKNNYESILVEMTSKYNIVEYGELIDSSKWERIFDAYNLKNDEEMPDFFHASGTMDILTMEGIIDIKFMSPNSSYMKMKIGSFFENVQVETDSLSWEYDSTEKVTTISEPSSNEGILPFELETSDFSYVIDIQNVTIDSKEAYKLTYDVDGHASYEYIDKESFLLVRSEESGEVTTLGDYMLIEGLNFPTTIGYFTSEDNFKMTFNDLNTNPFSESVFEMPEEYKKKIVYTDNEEEDYNDTGLAFFDEEDYENALIYFDKALEQKPTNYTILENKALSNQMLENYYEAIAGYLKSIDSGNETAMVHNRLGVCKVNLGDYQNSIQDFKKSIEIDKSFLQGYENLLFVYEEIEEFDTGLDLIDDLIELDIDSSAYYKQGDFRLYVNMNEEAVESFSKSIENGYATDETYNYLGVSYHRIENFEGALKNYLKAYEEDNTNYYYTKNVADAYVDLEDYSNAIQFYESALTFDEIDNKEYLLYSYATALKRNDWPDPALKAINEAIEINNADADLYDLKGFILYDLELYNDAVDAFTRSLGLYPDDPSIYYWRAISNENRNNRHSACLDFQKAAELGHDDAKVKLKEYCNIELDIEPEKEN